MTSVKLLRAVHTDTGFHIPPDLWAMASEVWTHWT